ncbi:MAG: hypothetical protein JWQ24_2771 [Tardiphaga sp.]|nr:hypothetical protein [Tardiphaga sp.]
MGTDKIRYLVFSKGRWRWQPTKAMRKHGFGTVNLSQGGPEKDSAGRPRPTDADKAKALRLNSDWDSARLGLPPQKPADAPVRYAPGSVGDGYYRAMAIRRAARAQAKIVWTVEQTKRDSWPRAWRFLEPEFADCDPKTIEPEHFIRIDEKTGEPLGLIPRIEREVSVTERHLVIKIWRALWNRMVAMKYCDAGQDPSKAFENSAPDPRQVTWMRREVLKLVQIAWRHNFRGLAACMAVAWDSMLSPIDARSLTLGQLRSDSTGLLFALDRAKTNKAAAATLTPWSQALLREYINGFGAEFLMNAPIFRTTPTLTVPGRGGRPRPSVPYTKDRLVKDFDRVRELAYGPDETRQFSDMRRSGAVEGDAGGGTVVDQANKMANTVSASNRLRKTYNPVNVPSVRRFDEARAVGARNLEQNLSESISANPMEILLRNTKNSEPLK